MKLTQLVLVWNVADVDGSFTLVVPTNQLALSCSKP